MAGKKYEKIVKGLDLKKIYTIDEASKVVKNTSFTKFDASLDLSFSLNLDTTQPEQQLRGTFSLPNSISKPIKILAICDGNDEVEAKKAGADFVGAKDKIEEIKSGWMAFDLIITTPKFMTELGKLGKQLGPKGLMPNPKLGTVTANVGSTVTEFKKGKQEFRTDKDGNLHFNVGKVSFAPEKIKENIDAVIALVKSKKPSTVKGNYFKSLTISTTMGPGLKLELPRFE
jgi:large subunit ribosomal protein L1